MDGRRASWLLLPICIYFHLTRCTGRKIHPSSLLLRFCQRKIPLAKILQGVGACMLPNPPQKLHFHIAAMYGQFWDLLPGAAGGRCLVHRHLQWLQNAADACKPMQNCIFKRINSSMAQKGKMKLLTESSVPHLAARFGDQKQNRSRKMLSDWHRDASAMWGFAKGVCRAAISPCCCCCWVGFQLATELN